MTATASRPALVIVVDGEPAATELTRVRAADLRLAQKQRDYLRAEAARAGREPDAVALEVDVVIDEHAAQARASYAGLGATADGVTYVGTPSGLKSLIEDVYAAEVADAVVLRPVGGDRTQQLIASLLAA
ncbi:putative protein OS=Tsukamurella paurometabola (strain ATCC 8368 / DSM / CCUG 35730 /CIP 100753 / JCM 10117 / KCTC 9821 / NBRC 16120 / NCIMB 702349/ NCTC 13040) OX=521096 GN=Tpau_0547 PE=4 SV=1 [Tsukamurella paurometabola]|uniref:Uncharacterized protein n=1 Tax=Tsukamurella paurometabola (strain ATCC 8368 / DSM 20162 / CCUG 35730 / CIP 100753 / JCM 10117 / KCTC 9821 / NBRC 16120 / NCIMB 702349 / NCTC 13040) TaxID=521096 RepID=D5USC0_TSUPD|nr:hypothetical protein [Tsukamurella paurometabola]ADG77187.1 hypothetical protein Tpau_0547 [Tsukamurella paurometabola DSM 20162]SUP43096.1 Uncharacterised protein [Tsukamurella paurometabola]